MRLRRRFHVFLKGLSLRAGLVAMLVAASIVPTVIVHAVHARRIERVISVDVVSYGRQIVERTAGELDLLISQVETARTEVLGQLVLSRAFWPGTPPPESVRAEQLNEMAVHLKTLTWAFPSIVALYVINWDRQVYSNYPSGLSNQYYSGEELLRQPWIRAILHRPLAEVVTSAHVPAYVFPDASKLRRVVSFAKHMNSFGRAGLNTIIQVDLDYDRIAQILAGADLGPDGFLLVTDARGEIIADTDGRLVGQPLAAAELGQPPGAGSRARRRGSRPGIVVERPVTGVDWRVVGVIPTGRLLAQYRELRLAGNLMVLLVGLVSVVAALFLSDLVASPIRRLAQVVRRLGEGDVSVDVPDLMSRDLSALTESVAAIVTEIDALTRRAVLSEAEERDAKSRVKALFGSLAKARTDVARLSAEHGEAAELRSRVRKYERLLALGEPAAGDLPQVQDARIGRAVDYMARRYDDAGLSLAEVADYVSLEPSYFSSKFKRVVGRGFSEYLVSLRLERAKHLLETPQLRVREVAEMVGYRDVHYFSRVFRKREGSRPSDYRSVAGKSAK